MCFVVVVLCSGTSQLWRRIWQTLSRNKAPVGSSTPRYRPIKVPLPPSRAVAAAAHRQAITTTNPAFVPPPPPSQSHAKAASVSGVNPLTQSRGGIVSSPTAAGSTLPPGAAGCGLQKTSASTRNLHAYFRQPASHSGAFVPAGSSVAVGASGAGFSNGVLSATPAVAAGLPTAIAASGSTRKNLRGMRTRVKLVKADDE